jgi:hypothetical protein
MTGALFADGGDSVWKRNGIEVLGSEAENGQTLIRLREPSGREFSVKRTDEPDDQTVAAILRYISLFAGWESASIETIDFLIQPKSIEIHIVPSRFVCDERDIMPHLPAGFIFSVTEIEEYNFRITKENLFIRISGIFKGERELCKKIVSALDNPLPYIKRDDINYLATRTDDLERKTEILELDGRRTKEALIAQMNRGFFGGPRPIPRATIDRILSIRSAEPRIGKKELYERLRAEKREISERELGFVLGVFFGE